ncbi:MAG: hypothetical protein GY842_27630 [bacterium]|nr:hypothetical protein [bacterium]
MGKRFERRFSNGGDLNVPQSRSCPSNGKAASTPRESAHRVLTFKCQRCRLEFQVRTWRRGDDVEKHFRFCPECGTKDSSYFLQMFYARFGTFEKLQPPPPDELETS